MNQEMAISSPDNDSSTVLPLVIGVDLGGTQLRAAVLRGMTLLSRVAFLISDNPEPAHVIPLIFEAIHDVLNLAGVTIQEVVGIGIAAPGPLNSYSGVVYAPPNLQGWENVPLRAILQEEFAVPIFLENDANAAALGEYMFGAGRGSRHMVYLTISTGIGGGVISDGRIIEGVCGTAGELGHTTVDWRGERCNCGNIGCLESISSGTGIARAAKRAIARGLGDDLVAFALERRKEIDDPNVNTLSAQLDARTVALAAEAGIPLAREIIANAAEALGVGLVNIIHIFNPEIIILGGGVTLMGDLLLVPARRIVEERCMTVPREAVRIVQAQLGSDVGLVGAGALLYYHQDV